MNGIRRKMYLFITVTLIGGVLTFIYFIYDLAIEAIAPYLFWLTVFITAVAACLSILEKSKLEAAQLIIDNQIFHICALQIVRGDQKESRTNRDIEAFVSCFGILMNNKIVKFNQAHIQLKSVEMEGNYIILTYGSAKKDRVIRLLHADMKQEEAERIKETFHYETGIIPKVINNLNHRR
jgi:hypothetical protein